MFSQSEPPRDSLGAGNRKEVLQWVMKFGSGLLSGGVYIYIYVHTLFFDECVVKRCCLQICLQDNVSHTYPGVTWPSMTYFCVRKGITNMYTRIVSERL